MDFASAIVTEEPIKLFNHGRMRQLVSDGPIGAFLSGGIDSSLVTALMRKAANSPVKTFSIRFREKAFNEADHACEVARHLGTEHTEVIFSAPDALALVPKISSIYDEPFGDPSQLPTYMVSQMARAHVTVALSGDGGDETFGGYVRYRGVKKMWAAMRYVPEGVRRLIAAGIDKLSAED